jgi:hypothetical protein
MAKQRIKLPKRIAGVKIPKAIRKGPVAAFLSSPGGQMAIAEAVIALGATYVARRINSGSSVGEAIRDPIETLRTRTGANGAQGSSERFTRAWRAGLDAFRMEWQGSQDLDADNSDVSAGGASTAAAEPAGNGGTAEKKPVAVRGDPRRELREASSGLP